VSGDNVRIVNEKGIPTPLPDLTSGAAKVLEQGVIGGGDNETSSGPTANNLTKTRRPMNRSILSAGTGVKNIGTGGTTAIYLGGIWVSAAMVGTLTITGLYAEDGTTAASAVIPIGFTGFWFLGNDAKFVNGCTVQKSSASDDAKIIIDWTPMA